VSELPQTMAEAVGVVVEQVERLRSENVRLRRRVVELEAWQLRHRDTVDAHARLVELSARLDVRALAENHGARLSAWDDMLDGASRARQQRERPLLEKFRRIVGVLDAIAELQPEGDQ
jgi:hypothetical protein